MQHVLASSTHAAQPVMKMAEAGDVGGDAIVNESAGELTENTTEHPQDSSLPQLRFETFPGQIFWLAIVFIALYIVLQRFALPRVASVLENRANRIQQDLDRAAHYQKQAADARDTYERTQAEARQHTQSLMDAVQERMTKMGAESQASMDATLKSQMQEAESRIRVMRESAMQNAAGASTELASTIVEKILQVKPSSEQLQSAMNAAVTRRLQ